MTDVNHQWLDKKMTCVLQNIETIFARLRLCFRCRKGWRRRFGILSASPLHRPRSRGTSTDSRRSRTSPCVRPCGLYTHQTRERGRREAAELRQQRWVVQHECAGKLGSFILQRKRKYIFSLIFVGPWFKHSIAFSLNPSGATSLSLSLEYKWALTRLG